MCLTECARVMRGNFASCAQGTHGDVDAALAATSTEAETEQSVRLSGSVTRASTPGSTFRGQSQRETESHAEFTYVLVHVHVHVLVSLLSPPLSLCFCSSYFFCLFSVRHVKSRRENRIASN